MMRTSSHGGNCCGIIHIPNFFKASLEELKRIVKSYNGRCSVRGVLLEVVITDNQIASNPLLIEYLQKTQFVLVSRFKNRNSGNTCNVFHFHPNRLSVDPKDLPFNWKDNE